MAADGINGGGKIMTEVSCVDCGLVLCARGHGEVEPKCAHCSDIAERRECSFRCSCNCFVVGAKKPRWSRPPMDLIEVRWRAGVIGAWHAVQATDQAMGKGLGDLDRAIEAERRAVGEESDLDCLEAAGTDVFSLWQGSLRTAAAQLAAAVYWDDRWTGMYWQDISAGDEGLAEEVDKELRDFLDYVAREVAFAARLPVVAESILMRLPRLGVVGRVREMVRAAECVTRALEPTDGGFPEWPASEDVRDLVASIPTVKHMLREWGGESSDGQGGDEIIQAVEVANDCCRHLGAALANAELARDALRAAAESVEADLMGNADSRVRGDFVLIEKRRVDRLLDALRETRDSGE